MKVNVTHGATNIFSGESYAEAKESLFKHFKDNYVESPILESEVCVDVKTDIEVYIISDSKGNWDTYILEITYT